jgi:hypothetical protein
MGSMGIVWWGSHFSPLFPEESHDHNHRTSGRSRSFSCSTSQCRTTVISSRPSRASLPTDDQLPLLPPQPYTNSIVAKRRCYCQWILQQLAMMRRPPTW